MLPSRRPSGERTRSGDGGRHTIRDGRAPLVPHDACHCKRRAAGACRGSPVSVGLRCSTTPTACGDRRGRFPGNLILSERPGPTRRPTRPRRAPGRRPGEPQSVCVVSSISSSWRIPDQPRQSKSTERSRRREDRPRESRAIGMIPAGGFRNLRSGLPSVYQGSHLGGVRQASATLQAPIFPASRHLGQASRLPKTRGLQPPGTLRPYHAPLSLPNSRP